MLDGLPPRPMLVLPLVNLVQGHSESGLPPAPVPHTDGRDAAAKPRPVQHAPLSGCGAAQAGQPHATRVAAVAPPDIGPPSVSGGAEGGGAQRSGSDRRLGGKPKALGGKLLSSLTNMVRMLGLDKEGT